MRYHSLTPYTADMPGHDIITLFVFPVCDYRSYLTGLILVMWMANYPRWLYKHDGYMNLQAPTSYYQDVNNCPFQYKDLMDLSPTNTNSVLDIQVYFYHDMCCQASTLSHCLRLDILSLQINGDRHTSLWEYSTLSKSGLAITDCIPTGQ